MASDEEVEAQRETLVELRARLDEAKAGGSDAQRELENEITLANMAAEEARLRAQIAEAEALNRTQESGASAPLDVARRQMELAVAQQEALEAQKLDAQRAAAPPAPGEPTAPVVVEDDTEKVDTTSNSVTPSAVKAAKTSPKAEG